VESDKEEGSEGSDEEDGNRGGFYRQVSEAFRDCSDSDPVNVAMEINSLKMGYNKTYSDCLLGFYSAMLDLLSVDPAFQEVKTAKLKAEKITEFLQKWKPLLVRFIHSADDRLTLLQAIEIFCF